MNQPLDIQRDELLHAVDRDRAQMRRALEQFRYVMRERTDLKQRIGRKPYHWLMGSFAIGFLLGLRADHKQTH